MTSDRHAQQLGYVSPQITKDSGPFVLLEQEKWAENINYLTKLGVVGYLNELLYGGAATTEFCTKTNEEYAIYAYPFPSDLNYKIGTSHGLLSPAHVQKLQYTEILQCDLKLELTPKYPVDSIMHYDWIGDAYDPFGSVLVRPSIRSNGKTLTVGAEVYGSIFLTYVVCRHAYSIRIGPLAGATENALQAWIYACWDYGNTVMECKFPDGADKETCQNSQGKSGSAVVNDKSPPRCVSEADTYKTSDWCDQKMPS